MIYYTDNLLCYAFTFKYAWLCSKESLYILNYDYYYCFYCN